MESLIKYKHYLILIITLVVVKIIVEPLWQNIQIERQALLLSEKQVNRIERLVEKQEHILVQQTKIDKSLLKLLPYLYKTSDDATFKLTAQSEIEKTLREASCNIEQIGWDGMSEVTPKFRRWQLKARFKGGPKCLISSTRLLEALKPLVRINNFYYAGKEIEDNPNAKVTGRLELVMWQYVTESNL